MTPFIAGIIGMVCLFILLFLRFPISWSMLLIGVIGYCVIVSTESGINLLGRVPFSSVSSYELGVIPLFILMGNFFLHSGFGNDLYNAMYKWLGRLPGGLGIATIGACAAFAAVCGSAPATVATIGSVALPEMKKYKYDDALACGLLAGGSTLGILIPPSVILVIYGLLTEQSIGPLFIAGIIPGLLLTALFMLTILIIIWRNPKVAPKGETFTFREKLATIKTAWVVVFLFLAVVIGIYVGIFTPTEAASIGAFLALVTGLVRRRINWQIFKNSVTETVKSTGMVFCALIGGYVLSYFLAVTKIPMEMATWMVGLDMPPIMVIVIILAIMFILGCFMEGMVLIILMIPVIYPIIQQLGFDTVWFGVIVVIITAVGLMTPPIGSNVFLTTLIAKDVPMYTVFRGVIPFVIASFVFTALILAFPQIVLFLPNLLYG